MIVFTCTSCSKQLKVKDELAGKKGKCPSCGTQTTVPGDRTGTIVAEKSILPNIPAKNQTIASRALQTGAGNETQTGVAESRRPAAGDNETIDAERKPDRDSDDDLTGFLAPPEQSDEIGRLGGYRVLEVLGQGGMGVVYRAEDTSLNRHVALKVMLPAMAKKAENRARFLREAKTGASIRNDHVVGIFAVGEDRGVPFLAMEFLEGEPLDVRLKRGPAFSMEEVIRLGRETALGLAAAHAKGLVHRDIKPGNLWLDGERRRLKILDFGLARLADDTHLTKSGAIIGTPAFMAPEQASGVKVDHRCDLFSLGCVLYRMVTGVMPFKGGDTMSILMALATETAPAAHEVNSDVPIELSDLLAELMEKQPAHRPANAKLVAEQLAEIEASLSDPASQKKPSRTTAKKKSPRRRLWTIAAGIVGLAAAMAGIVLFWQTPEGAVKLESDDPDVQIVFDKTGPTIKGIDKEPIALRAGEHGVLVKRGDFEFLTDKLLIKRGQTVALKVTLLRNKLQVFRDGVPLDEKDLPLVATLPSTKTEDPGGKKLDELTLPPAKSANKNFLRVVDKDAGPATAMAFNNAGRRLISAHGSALRLWDGENGKLIAKWEDNSQGAIYHLAFSPDDTMIASGSELGVQLHQARTLESRETSIKGNVSVLTFSPDSATLIAGVSSPGEAGGLRAVATSTGADKGPFAYSLLTGLKEPKIRPHPNRIAVLTFVTFMERERALVSIDESGGVHAWNVDAQPRQVRLSQSFNGFAPPTEWAGFAADNTSVRGYGNQRSLAIAGLHPQRRLISVKYAFSGILIGNDPKIFSLNSLPGSFDAGSPVRRLAFASAGNYLLGAMEDGSLSVWEHLTFDRVAKVVLDSERQSLRNLAVSGDGLKAAVSVGAGIEIAAISRIIPEPENTPERTAALRLLDVPSGEGPELLVHRRAGLQPFSASVNSPEQIPARAPIAGVIWRMKAPDEHLALLPSFKELDTLGIQTASYGVPFDVAESHLKIIESLLKLKSLNIGGARFPAGAFKRLKNLDSVFFVNGKISTQDIADLAVASPKLKFITLMKSNVTDDMISGFTAFPALERLVLDDTKATDEGIQKALERFPPHSTLQFNQKVFPGKKK